MTRFGTLDEYLSEALIFKNNLEIEEGRYQDWVKQIKTRYASLPEIDDYDYDDYNDYD